MKLIDLTCSKCGATLQINPELSKCMCQYCGNEMLIDNEVQHHSLDNGFEFGYQAEMGRQRAQFENEIELANRAFNTFNWRDAHKHFKILESLNPNNIEAIYFSRLCELLIELSSLENILIRQRYFNAVTSALKIIKGINTNLSYTEKYNLINKMLINTYKVSTLEYVIRIGNNNDVIQLRFGFRDILFEILDLAIYYRDEYEDEQVHKMFNDIIINASLQIKQAMHISIIKYDKNVKEDKLDPRHKECNKYKINTKENTVKIKITKIIIIGILIERIWNLIYRSILSSELYPLCMLVSFCIIGVVAVKIYNLPERKKYTRTFRCGKCKTESEVIMTYEQNTFTCPKCGNIVKIQSVKEKATIENK